MPLGKRTDFGDARFAGVEVEQPASITDEVDSARLGGFDFVVTPLAAHAEQRTSTGDALTDASFTRQDMVDGAIKWSSVVVGHVSTWIDLDSTDAVLRRDSIAAFAQEVGWAAHIGLQAVVTPAPKSFSIASNYGQVLNRLLASLTCMAVWVRLPYSADACSSGDPWSWWDKLRSLCRYNPLLGVLLDVGQNLPSEPFSERWIAEPVRAVVLSTNVFISNKRGYPVLTKPHQALVNAIFALGLQVVVSTSSLDSSGPDAGTAEAAPTPAESVVLAVPDKRGEVQVGTSRVVQRIRLYWEYLSYLFQKLDPLEGQELLEFGYRDYLQLPLQPLADNLENATYETFERDTIKYTLYQEAIRRALEDRRASGSAASDAFVVSVVGAGRGPLVQAAIQAAEAVGVCIKVYAIEKNPNAVALLRVRVQSAAWKGVVTLVAQDMRHWEAPELADILVSELLGSFGDNELSPECLDCAQACLKDDGVSIPSASTSYLAPMSSHKVYTDLLARRENELLETPMVVKLVRHALLADPQPIFRFVHPNRDARIDNERFGTFEWRRDLAAPPATMHGFAGYFDTTLYKDVVLSTVPSRHTPEMHSWFPIYFPLKNPVHLHAGSTISASIWRFVRSSKVWYEWAVTEPDPGPLHNPDGKLYNISL